MHLLLIPDMTLFFEVRISCRLHGGVLVGTNLVNIGILLCTLFISRWEFFPCMLRPKLAWFPLYVKQMFSKLVSSWLVAGNFADAPSGGKPDRVDVNRRLAFALTRLVQQMCFHPPSVYLMLI